MPGPYVIRTAPTKSNDGMSYLATFYPDGTEVQFARQVPVELDRTWSGVDFPLVAGKLYREQGKLLMPYPVTTDSIELISDTGRQKVHSGRAENVASGDYEIYAEGHAPSGHFAAWQLFPVEHDTDLNVPHAVVSGVVRLHFRRAAQAHPGEAGESSDAPKGSGQRRAQLTVAIGPNDFTPGDRQIRIEVGEEFYRREVRIMGKKVETRSRESAEDWVVGRIPNIGLGPLNSASMGIVLSSKVASVTGRVTDRSNEVAPYAPVWLETMGLPPDPALIREARLTARQVQAAVVGEVVHNPNFISERDQRLQQLASLRSLSRINGAVAAACTTSTREIGTKTSSTCIGRGTLFVVEHQVVSGEPFRGSAFPMGDGNRRNYQIRTDMELQILAIGKCCGLA